MLNINIIILIINIVSMILNFIYIIIVVIYVILFFELPFAYVFFFVIEKEFVFNSSILNLCCKLLRRKMMNNCKSH